MIGGIGGGSGAVFLQKGSHAHGWIYWLEFLVLVTVVVTAAMWIFLRLHAIPEEPNQSSQPTRTIGPRG